MLTELFSRNEAVDMDAALPRIRTDLTLHASLPWGKPLTDALEVRLVIVGTGDRGGLEHIEPLTPDDHVRESASGNIEILE